MFVAMLEWLFKFFPLPNPLANVYSDASVSFGSGAFVESLGLFKFAWPIEFVEVDISVKELALVVVGATLW